MKRKIAKIVLFVFIMTIVLSLAASMIVLAEEGPAAIAGAANGKNITSVPGINNLTTIAKTVFGYIQLYGSIIAVIILAYYGFKYITASPAEKAKLKENAFTYLVGALFIFGGAQIIGWVGTFAKDLLK
jgi:hypothetical protein